MKSSYDAFNGELEMNVKNDLDQSLFPSGLKESTTDGIAESPGINPFSTFPNNDTTWLTQDINRPHSAVCIIRVKLFCGMT